MKYILKTVIIFSSFLSIKSFAQLDTLNYLKQFEVNKANYIGQPFSKILNEMTQIQPKAVWPSPNFANKNYNYHTTFSFCDMDFSFYNTIMLRIEWQIPLQRTDTKYYQLLNNSYFTNDERTFYGSKIVKDIQVYR